MSLSKNFCLFSWLVRNPFTIFRRSSIPLGSSFLGSSTALVTPERVCWVGAGLPYSADPFCLVGQYLEMCPFCRHLKQAPVSQSFCFSLLLSWVKRGRFPMFLASTSMAFGS